MTVKLCSKCNIFRSIDKFYKRISSKDGFAPWCKQCHKEYKQSKEYRAKAILYAKKYYVDNTEQCRERARKYQKNSPKAKEYKKLYKEENFEKTKRDQRTAQLKRKVIHKERDKENYKRFKNNNPTKIKKYNEVYAKNKLKITSTLATQLANYENMRMSDCRQYLEVQCIYCKTWFIPTNRQVQSRLNSINGLLAGESNLYCSDECKDQCPVFGRISWPKDFKPKTNRPEVSKWLISQALDRDEHSCQRCGSKDNLQVHHIMAATQYPEYANDLDNLITFCDECHYDYAHQLPGCHTRALKQIECSIAA